MTCGVSHLVNGGAVKLHSVLENILRGIADVELLFGRNYYLVSFGTIESGFIELLIFYRTHPRLFFQEVGEGFILVHSYLVFDRL